MRYSVDCDDCAWRWPWLANLGTALRVQDRHNGLGHHAVVHWAVSDPEPNNALYRAIKPYKTQAAGG